MVSTSSSKTARDARLCIEETVRDYYLCANYLVNRGLHCASVFGACCSTLLCDGGQWMTNYSRGRTIFLFFIFGGARNT